MQVQTWYAIRKRVVMCRFKLLISKPKSFSSLKSQEQIKFHTWHNISSTWHFSFEFLACQFPALVLNELLGNVMLTRQFSPAFWNAKKGEHIKKFNFKWECRINFATVIAHSILKLDTICAHLRVHSSSALSEGGVLSEGEDLLFPEKEIFFFSPKQDNISRLWS